jgi:nitroimidazol reductase NimA-like FMN-containing flavoprotein (pyridoxamine 5'-phosphate oxidase superfamily)
MDDASRSPDECLEVLDRDRCLLLLRGASVGRVAVVRDGRPEIFPVSFATQGRAIAFRTARDTVLDASAGTHAAFEVDGRDAESGEAWSVMVRGVLHDVTGALDPSSESVRRLAVLPLAPGERTRWMALSMDEVSGRRFPVLPEGR